MWSKLVFRYIESVSSLEVCICTEYMCLCLYLCLFSVMDDLFPRALISCRSFVIHGRRKKGNRVSRRVPDDRLLAATAR